MTGHNMLDQFFAFTETFVEFAEADKALLGSVLTHRQVGTKAELVSFDKQTDELFFDLKN